MLAAVAASCDYFRYTDGRIRSTLAALNERNRVLQCLEAAGRDGAHLPAPVASAQAGR
jgi:hypothetical protein